MVKHVWPDGSVFWQFPGGGVAPCETLEEAVVRELKEETGLIGGRARLLFELPYEKGVSTTFLLEVDEGAIATLGIDPEDVGRAHKKLVEVGWVKIREMNENPEVRELLKHIVEEPNQALEPTLPGVTPRAEAKPRVAPPGIVAHLER